MNFTTKKKTKPKMSGIQLSPSRPFHFNMLSQSGWNYQQENRCAANDVHKAEEAWYANLFCRQKMLQTHKIASFEKTKKQTRKFSYLLTQVRNLLLLSLSSSWSWTSPCSFDLLQAFRCSQGAQRTWRLSFRHMIKYKLIFGIKKNTGNKKAWTNNYLWQ